MLIVKFAGARVWVMETRTKVESGGSQLAAIVGHKMGGVRVPADRAAAAWDILIAWSSC